MSARSDKEYGKLIRQIGMITTIPMIFVVGPLVGYGIGQWVDKNLGTGPWGMVGVTLLGFISSLKQVIAIIRRWIRETERER